MAAHDRSAHPGVIIAAALGVTWTFWGASGLEGTVAGTIRLLGIVIGLAIMVAIVLLRSGTERDAPTVDRPVDGRSRSMFASPSYPVVVVVEVIAMGVGNALLAALDHSDYVIAWVAVVIGAHFLALGRLFFPGFYWLGAALIAAGLTGAIAGALGGGAAGIKVASALTAAASLFGSGGWAVVGQLRVRRRAAPG